MLYLSLIDYAIKIAVGMIEEYRAFYKVFLVFISLRTFISTSFDFYCLYITAVKCCVTATKSI